MPNFNYKIIVIIYMVIMSVIGFVSMGIDKKRAINKNGASLKNAVYHCVPRRCSRFRTRYAYIQA